MIAALDNTLQVVSDFVQTKSVFRSKTWYDYSVRLPSCVFDQEGVCLNYEKRAGSGLKASSEERYV